MGPFPFSAGTAVARCAPLAGACDAHIHVYDQRVAAAHGTRLRPPDASLQDYRRVQARMGTRRAVVVTPSTYGSDNRLMLEAVAALGGDGRGVAVLHGDEPLAQLQQWHDQGVRGARINGTQGAPHDASAISRLAEQIAPLGWHLQLLVPTEHLLALKPLLQRLPVALVLDHFGRIAPAQCGLHPAHALILDGLRSGRLWVKLSGGYLVSPLARSEDPALDALARSYIEAAPDRVLWGSNWPHPTASAGLQPLPDDARQIERLADWAGSPERLQQILVRNPERLYGFRTEQRT